MVLTMTWGIGWTFITALKVWKTFHWWTLFVKRIWCLSYKISEELCVITLKGDAKFKGKLTCSWKNNLSNLVNFHSRSQKSLNLHFDGFLLSEAYKDLSEKVQKRYVSWYWRVMQSLNKNWLLVPKMTREIWWILMWAVASLKVCTLISYFCRKYLMFELTKYRGVVSWKMNYCFKNDISNLVTFHTSSWK